MWDYLLCRPLDLYFLSSSWDLFQKKKKMIIESKLWLHTTNENKKKKGKKKDLDGLIFPSNSFFLLLLFAAGPLRFPSYDYFM